MWVLVKDIAEIMVAKAGTRTTNTEPAVLPNKIDSL